MIPTRRAARRAAPIHPVRPSRRTAFPVLLLLALLTVLPLAGCGGAEDAPDPAGTATTAPGAADPGPAAPATPTGGPANVSEAAQLYGDLSPHYRGLVRAEMTNLEPAMQRLMAFIARGDARMGAFTARQIEETFVLQRSLSEEERQRLQAELPAKFVELDREFHARAGQVAAALDDGRFREASDLYGEMTRLCVSCHGRYALGRFPRLAGVPAAEEAEAAAAAEAEEAAEAEDGAPTDRGDGPADSADGPAE